MDVFTRAATNRSLRTIQTELDFLQDAGHISAADASRISNLLPSAGSTSNRTVHSPAPSRASTNAFSEKQQPIVQPTPSPGPPSYGTQSPPPLPPGRELPPQQQPQGIATVSALYAYKPSDDGDLELAVSDKVIVLEWMNADWARGRSQRTGAEGIFPRSYAKVVEDEKAGMGFQQPAYQQQQWQQPMPYRQGSAPQDQGPASYGNMPMAMAQGGQQQGQPQPDSKVNTQGKKFGKKLGNAAIFGAGASIGSNIVNGIL